MEAPIHQTGGKNQKGEGKTSQEEENDFVNISFFISTEFLFSVEIYIKKITIIFHPSLPLCTLNKKQIELNLNDNYEQSLRIFTAL